MRASPEVDEIEPAEEPAWHAPMLRELAELGMRMARAVTIGAEARAEAGEATAADEAASSLALQRAAKMVRLTVALDWRLVAAQPAIDFESRQPAVDDADAEARRLEAADDAVWVIRNLWKLVGKPLVRNTIALAIETESEGAERERLLADLHERLVEREDDLIARGPGQYQDIINGFIGELGLSGVRLGSGDPAWAARPGASAGGFPSAYDPGAPRPVAQSHPPP
jgi:hypothetical protein